MDTGASFITMLMAMLLVMALGFMKILGNVEPVILLYGFMVLLLLSVFSLKILSYKVNLIRQYDIVVSIEPKGKSTFFVALYKAIYFSNSVISGALSGSMILFVANDL